MGKKSLCCVTLVAPFSCWMFAEFRYSAFSLALFNRLSIASFLFASKGFSQNVNLSASGPNEYPLLKSNLELFEPKPKEKSFCDFHLKKEPRKKEKSWPAYTLKTKRKFFLRFPFKKESSCSYQDRESTQPDKRNLGLGEKYETTK